VATIDLFLKCPIKDGAITPLSIITIQLNHTKKEVPCQRTDKGTEPTNI
jgi:hypothetical protein